MEALACTNCGATLPEGSQFCLKCGQAIQDTEPGTTIEVPEAEIPEAVVVSSRTLPRVRVWRQPQQRKRPRIVLSLLVLLLPLAIWWTASSDMPAAQQVRNVFTTSETEAIIPASFSVNPHSFAAYKFTVPASASSVVLSGQFKAAGGPANDVEVHVLADAAFAAWQSGYSTSTYYSSGRVSQGEINASLPPGAGSYYIVFNNKFSARMAKAVQSDVDLRYNRWLPDWMLKIKEQFWTPFGLAVPSG